MRDTTDDLLTMPAAILAGPGETLVIEAPLPRPGPGEVRVRLEGCGVCASNLGPWAGPEWMEYPTAPGGLGHEGWGVIDSIGPEVEGLNIGQRVAVLSQNAYAGYDVAPASAVVPLPPALDGRPFPGEPLGCAMNIFHRAGIRPGDHVAIIGIGFLGALLVQLATQAGARVVAISRRESSRRLADDMGAETTIPMADHWEIIEEARKLTDGRFFDCVIECVGKQWPLDLAAELVRERGRLVIAGFHQDGPRQVNMQLWNWRGMDVINAHERDPAIYVQGIREAVAAVADGRLNPDPLYTHVYPLSRLDEALNDTRDKPGAFVKAWIRYE